MIGYTIFALLALLAIGSLIVATFYAGKMPLFIFIPLVVIAIALVAIQSVEYNQQRKQIEFLSGTAELKPKKIADISYPQLMLGTAKLEYTGTPGQAIFQVGLDPVTVWGEDGRLKLSTVIRNEKGDVVARLDANVLRVVEGQMYDHNYDKTALEVIDGENRVILQVEFEDGIAQFRGIFHDKDGGSYALGDNIIEVRPPGVLLETSFKPIFYHPGFRHIGKRLDN